ncbi:VIT family protein [Saccharothrix violaceirubra]|uniref:VIT1/CCC1 family predicted Fe2+/Mn2+ transporter n=1 Tax=Saccharothrix violaceirubra TaxID=413306 RepID=A0A7W7T216_9PSEU|nr:VIT family protein [Saccharothrix violaceirubra]MBB4964811.1 VIT1/CCC1 family predicted Fe2+/Mn2+ transporter [Saccharothrix violaceirubra]
MAHPEPQALLSQRVNRLRAGVLGANDGIVSTAGLVVGVAGAAADRTALLAAGIAGLVAGALSMAGGEYVSVSTQRDTERAALRLEEFELREMPEAEEHELAAIYREKGLRPELAAEVARELTAHDALRAHAEAELHIDPDNLTSPWQAALASCQAFALGALVPLLAIVLPPVAWRVWACAAAVLVGLALTGVVSARLGSSPVGPAVRRNVVVGTLTMAVTYGVGLLFGVTLG